MIMHMGALSEELTNLNKLNVIPELIAHPNCIIATVYHEEAQRLRERLRGSNNHGTCGMGIGEARGYWLRYGKDAITLGDLSDLMKTSTLLELTRQRLITELKASGIAVENTRLTTVFPGQIATHISAIARRLTVSEYIPSTNRPIIFEGAQGVLLDENYGFNPNTTWSTVTDRYAHHMLVGRDYDVKVLGVTRAYMTRHGPGLFPSECKELTSTIQDENTFYDYWRGGLRYGWLDIPLLEYAKSCLFQLDGLVVNCVDQIGSHINVVEEEYNVPDRAGLASPIVLNLPTRSLEINELMAKDYRSNMFGACAYYRSGNIFICLEACQTPCGEANSRNWTWSGSTIDREPYGVLAHELGHHCDMFVSKNKYKYSGDYGVRVMDQSGEAPLTGYCPNPAEWFAEMFRLFVTNHALLRKVRPRTWELLICRWNAVSGDDWIQELGDDVPERIIRSNRNKMGKAHA